MKATSSPPIYGVRQGWRTPFLIPFIIFILTSVTTLYTWQQLKDSQQTNAAIRFEQEVAQTTTALQGRMAPYQDALFGLRGLFIASKLVDREEWAQYVRVLEIEKHYPAIKGFGFVAYVPRQELQTYEDKTRFDGIPSYTVQRGSQEADYLPVKYVEPLVKNSDLLGYDFGSDPTSRLAAEHARDSGLPTISGKLNLEQAELKGINLLLFVPVYGKNLTPSTVVERQVNLEGWVFAAFQASDLLGGTNQAFLDFQVYDGVATSPEAILYEARPKSPFQDQNYQPAFSTTKSIEVAERTWGLIFTSNTTFDASFNTNQPATILVGGICLSGLLFCLTWFIVATRAKLAQTLVTLRHQADQLQIAFGTLSRSEQLYRTLAGNFPNGTVLLFDLNLRYLVADGSGLEKFGRSKEQLEGKTIWEALPAQASQALEPLYRAVLTSQPLVTEITYGNLTSEVHLLPLRDEQGKIFAGMMMSQDITERKRAEEQLRESETRFRMLAEILSAAIFIKQDNKLSYVNPAFESITGYSQQESLNLDFWELIRPAYQSLMRADGPARQNGEVIPSQFELQLVTKQGEERWVYLSMSIIELEGKQAELGTFIDITEKHKQEQELLKIQKLESLGVLAGGIAHDFNNILTAVVGFISLAKLEAEAATVPNIKELPRLLDEAENAAFKARGLTQQLLTFAKGGEPLKKVASLPALLEETTRFVLHGSKVSVKFEIDPDLWPVEIDEGQIGQVIHNLVLNAVQAMPQGGIITIKAENIASWQGEAGLPVSDCDYVKVSVKDEGTGIEPETIPKIFDPYFTTKSKGSGLGLASCYSIVNKHEGYISVQSQPGWGTTFFIYLPAVSVSAGSRLQGSRLPASEKSGAGPVKPWRVLALDDEVVILKLLKMTLSQKGYVVDVASEVGEAFELFQNALHSTNPYNLVILDLTVPGSKGGGLELLKQMLVLDPRVRALVASGYSNDPVMAHYREYGFVGALSKPYNSTQLLEKVAGVLGIEHPPFKQNDFYSPNSN